MISIKKIALEGIYSTYFPFRALIERSQMTPYLKKLFDDYKWLIRLNSITLSYQQTENLTCIVR